MNPERKLELFQLIDTNHDQPSPYPFMVWEVGPADEDNAVWFDNEDAAREYLKTGAKA